MKTHMGKPCDICGDIGDPKALATCCQCKIGLEHIYCRRTFDNVPDNWICEVCEMGSMISPKKVNEDSPKTIMSSPSGMEQVDRENTYSAGCSKFPKWEKIVKTGKVKYIPAQEVITLSSGAKKFDSPSKGNLHSGPSRIVVSKSTRTPIKPKAIPPKPASVIIKANPSFGSSGLSSSRHGNVQNNSVVQQQVIQTSKDPKEKEGAQALRKEHIQKEQPTDAVMSPVETKSASAKEEKMVNKASCASLLVHCPPIISSDKSISCGNDGTIESRNSNANNGDMMDILPKDEKCFHGPALDSSWKGSFEILDTINCKELNDGFQAHPPSKVRRKVYEFSQNMPELLQFKLLPYHSVWPEIFQDDCPDKDDIGLYFFSSKSQSSENYIFLLEFIETQKLVMRSYMNGVELFLFTSKLLSAESQRWNDEYFLWGVFRRVKKRKAVCELYEVSPQLVQPSDCAQDNDAIEDDNAVDMEIDMVAGKDVGRVDVAISRDSPKRSCGRSKGENDAVMSLNGSDTKIPAASKKLDFATQLPLLKEVKKELCSDIPPGFEKIHRLKVPNLLDCSHGSLCSMKVKTEVP